MTPGAIAARYARALLDVSRVEDDPRAVEQQLARTAAVLADHLPLQRVLLNPSVPAARKRAVIAALVARDTTLSPVVGRLLLVLADRDRLGLLPALLEAYRRRLMDHLGVVRADVTTAVPLTEDRARTLARSLAAATGRDVSLETRVDPALIGGAVARIGSTIYDGSVARQLERLREALTAAE